MLISLHLLVNIHCIVLGDGDDTGSHSTKKDVNRSLVHYQDHTEIFVTHHYQLESRNTYGGL